MEILFILSLCINVALAVILWRLWNRLQDTVTCLRSAERELNIVYDHMKNQTKRTIVACAVGMGLIILKRLFSSDEAPPTV